MSSALGRDLNAYQTCGEADTPSYRYSANVEIRWIDVEYIYIYIIAGWWLGIFLFSIYWE